MSVPSSFDVRFAMLPIIVASGALLLYLLLTPDQPNTQEKPRVEIDTQQITNGHFSGHISGVLGGNEVILEEDDTNKTNDSR